MSEDEIRTALAEAASAVEGITCTPYYVQHTQVGAACVQVDRHDYDELGEAAGTWNVVLWLGQDMAVAEQFRATKRPQLVAALTPVMRVTRVSGVQQLSLIDGTTVLATLINGFREEWT